MNKRKLFATALVAGLLLPGAIAPVAAKTADDLKLFLRWDDDGSGGCGATYLSTENVPDAGNGCAFIFQPAQEVLIAAGEEPLTHEWPGMLDKPVKMVRGSVEGKFEVRAFAASDATLEVALTATTRKGSLEVGSFTSDPFNGARQVVPIEFDIDVPKKLAKKKVTGFFLATTFRGLSAASYIELDDPAAFLTFPIQ